MRSRKTAKAPSCRPWTSGILLFFALLLPLAAFPTEVPSRVALPDPRIFLDEDTISIAVMKARPEDPGFRSLLSTAWSTMTRNGSRQMSPMLSTMFRFLQGSRGDDPLVTLLPVQAVRTDRMGSDGTPHPTIAVSVSGWAGLQSLYYGGLVVGPDGKPFPTREVGPETLVLRERWRDPTQAAILTRVRGTFLNFPTLAQAEQIVPRMYERNPTPPDTRLARAFAELDQSQDTYGVVLNRKRSLLKFLYWLNYHDMARIHEQIGKARLESVISHVEMLAWEGDLISDDRIDFTARFETDSPQARDEVKQVMLTARDVLAQYGRAGDLQINTYSNRVIVNFSMLGYRQALIAYLNASVR